MATIKHIQTPDGVTHDIGGGGGSTTYTLTKSGSTITLTGSGGDVSSVVDANTTYALSLSGHTLTLTPSSGTAQSVTIPDDNTTYTIGISGTTITLTPSSGTAQTVTIPDATTTSAGVMSASDKSKLNGIESGAEVNVQADWNQSNSSADDYIKNKPSLATVATTGDYDDLTNKPSLATVATTGDYDDLTNKPTIPTVNDGTLTIKQNGVTLDTFTANQSGNTTVDITASSGSTQNMWYGTCSTAGATIGKTVTTTTGDFSLTTGNMVRVLFSKGNTATTATLSVDGTTATQVAYASGNTLVGYMWSSREVVDFVYDGTYFVMSDGGTASTTYYGVTKLSSSTSSTATDVAATPSAVKAAYDLADSKVSDVEVNGTSVVSGGVASVTVPTATSDLTNDSNFVSDASYVHTDNNFTNADATKLSGIEAGAEVNVQSDWTQADSTADDYIKNKPTLATVATTGDYDDLIDTPNLATVATSGDYDDLTNKPTIPTVNNGTLTIEKNGTSVGTFTANQSGNSTANITVPTAVSDLTNDSGFTSVSVTQTLSSGTKIAEIDVDGTTTDLYAPSGGGGGVSDVLVDNVSVVTGGVAEIDLTDYVKEDSNGDISITRNISAGGDVTVDGNSLLDALYFQPGDTYVATGRTPGLCTSGSSQMQMYIDLPKSAKYCSGFTINDIKGGIRISTGGYADNVTDGTSWSGRSGISFGGALYNADGTGHVSGDGKDAYRCTTNLVKTSAFKQNGTNTNVVNNTPICLGGDIKITFT